MSAVPLASDAANAAIDWLAGQRGAMESALATLVDIDSNSHDKPGTDRVAQAMQSWLVAEGIDAEHHAALADGDVLLARLPGARPAEAPVVLMGHRDTVFPTGSVAQRPWRVEGERGYGPGVSDMKSGLVLQCFVLMALRRLPPLPFPVLGLFTADEEIGSQHGRVAIEAHARGARAAFNAEPGRVSGNLVTERKGGANFAIAVTGRAAHAGMNHADGASAIETLARKIQALHALTDYATGVTTNVGLISGGMSTNTVAPSAQAKLDVRFCTLAQREALFAHIQEVVAQPGVQGTHATVTQTSEFLPLEPRWSHDLMQRYQASAAQLGFGVAGEFTGGCSDAGFTASLGIPTLCGVGPVGAKAHTEAEYCCLDTLVPRAQALVGTILGLAAPLA
ncbi:M20 family metallopeptidase [Polaromonas jejuensis]|uniref:M20 family metallopeptidase n=1 Tax=Polaromonas jejuensis TaxID=457502 RepID=A0ABW0Q629_9BURK|nr:M20 family metallopeptidase [Polaromonas jejuensis]